MMLTRQASPSPIGIAEKLIPAYALSGVTVCMYGAGRCNDVIRDEAGS